MFLQKNKKILVIDASRNRSGGSIIYLKKFIENFDPHLSIFDKVIIFSYKELLNKLPKRKYLIKTEHFLLEKGLFFQIIWQLIFLPFFLKKNKVDLLYTTDSTTLCFYKPSIIFNQDILSFDKNSMQNISFGWEKLRLYIIRYIQILAMNNANEIIFVSNYSKNKISKFLKKDINSTVIYHGINTKYKKKYDIDWNINNKENVNLIYVSPVLSYKNHLTIVKAYKNLKKKYKNIKLKFIGDYKVSSNIYKNLFIEYPNLSLDSFLGNLNHTEVIKELEKSDIFIFSSSSETFGISLVEAMSIGIPIVCSNKSSLPEILGEGGIYFDPFSDKDLYEKLELLFVNPKLRYKITRKSIDRLKLFSWEVNFRKFNFLTKKVLGHD